MFIHGGQNNDVADNTFEVGPGTYAAGYQTRTGTNTALTGMAGNQFKNNNIYSPGGVAPATLVWVVRHDSRSRSAT